MKNDYPPAFYKALYRLEHFNWQLADSITDGAYDALCYTAIVDYPTEVVAKLRFGSGDSWDGEWDEVWYLAEKVFQKEKLLAVLGGVPRDAWTTETEAWEFVYGFIEEYLAYKTVEQFLLPNPWEPIIEVWEAGYLTLPRKPYSKRFDEFKLILACKNEWKEVSAFAIP